MSATFPDFPDISHYSTISSFHEMAAAGIRAVICKATQGATNTDPTYVGYVDRARSVGLIIGAYAYIEPNEAGIDMVHFESIAHLQPGDIQPIVDAETPGLTKVTTFAAMADLEAKGFSPILYASYSFWRDVLGSPTQWPLWLADYNAVVPCVSATTTVFAWQYSESAPCPGVTGHGDMNRVFYEASEFSRFLIPVGGAA